MRLPPLISVTVGLIATAAFMPAEPIIQKSDVVFMYQADPATYAAYQTTLLAWGGRPTEQSLQDAHGQGTAYFGSVGMVTEFGRYYERFPDTYQEGLGRDLDGAPIKVPWLVDHQHNGIPFWVCCTRQPNFRQYLHERVAETVRGGADGVHIDDHMGTAAFVWQGLCFCDRCEADFIPYLKTHLSDPEQVAHGIHEIDTFDYSDTVSAWLAANPSRQFNQHPLWRHWTVYHANYTVVFMAELKADAAEIAGHPVPFGANAGLLWPNHLADYQVLDLFSSETDHHANERRFSDLPVLAYRLADAVGRPYAATAAGSDWAFIKAHGLTELVRGWTALAYASGQLFMAPQRQWCHTDFLGTHWYDGPTEAYAPLYRFIRKNAKLFDDYENAPLAQLLFPYRAYTEDNDPWFTLAAELAAANIPYRILLAGDEIVRHPLDPALLRSGLPILAPHLDGMLPADRARFDDLPPDVPVFETVAALAANLKPSVRFESDFQLRALPRVKPDSAVIHLLNYEYEARSDSVATIPSLTLQLDLDTLGVPTARHCIRYAPGEETQTLGIEDGRVTLSNLGPWTILRFDNHPPATP